MPSRRGTRGPGGPRRRARTATRVALALARAVSVSGGGRRRGAVPPAGGWRRPRAARRCRGWPGTARMRSPATRSRAGRRAPAAAARPRLSAATRQPGGRRVARLERRGEAAVERHPHEPAHGDPHQQHQHRPDAAQHVLARRSCRARSRRCRARLASVSLRRQPKYTSSAVTTVTLASSATDGLERLLEHVSRRPPAATPPPVPAAVPMPRSEGLRARGWSPSRRRSAPPVPGRRGTCRRPDQPPPSPPPAASVVVVSTPPVRGRRLALGRGGRLGRGRGLLGLRRWVRAPGVGIAGVRRPLVEHADDTHVA